MPELEVATAYAEVAFQQVNPLKTCGICNAHLELADLQSFT